MILFVFILFAISVTLLILLVKSHRKINKISSQNKKYHRLCNQSFLELFLKNYQKDNRPVMIYASESFFITGGLEARVEAYCQKLAESGFRVIIVAGENEYKPLEKYDVCLIDLYADNAQECMMRLISAAAPKYLEFHFKSPYLLRNLDVEKLKKHTVVGCTIHNVIDAQFLSGYTLDYQCIVSKLLFDKYQNFLPKNKIVPNSVAEQDIAYKYPEKKPFKALIISRICKEKLPTLEAFIEFCQANEIMPYIGGPADGRKNIKKLLLKKYSLKEENFLGVVDLEILAQDAGNYLFVGGVGQVVLSAGILGYPVFLASHLGLKHSLFVTPENFLELAAENFTVKRCGICKKSADSLSQDFVKIASGNTETFNLHDSIIKNNSIDNVFADYLAYIKTCG